MPSDSQDEFKLSPDDLTVVEIDESKISKRVIDVVDALAGAVEDVVRRLGITYEEYELFRQMVTELGPYMTGVYDPWVSPMLERFHGAGRTGTSANPEGPFYLPGAPELEPPYTLMRPDEPGDLLIVRGHWFSIKRLLELVVVGHFEVCLLPKNHCISSQLCRFPQDLGQQDPALRIHFRHLPVVIDPVQELLSGRIHAGYLRHLLLNFLPLRQGVNLGPPSILAGDVKLRSVTLVNQALELRRQLEPAFFVHAGWVIATKHPVAFSSLLLTSTRSRGSGLTLPWRPNSLFSSLLPQAQDEISILP